MRPLARALKRTPKRAPGDSERRSHAADLRGLNQLSIDGIIGIVALVESMHSAITRIPGLQAKSAPGHTTGITRYVYWTIGGVTKLVGHTIDRLLAGLASILGDRSTWPGRETLVAALNGIVGDYLAASGNPLAITMRMRCGGIPLPPERRGLASALPQATGKLVVLVHGLCLSDLAWKRNGHDHGVALAHDLGYTPVYLHYNTGLHVSNNGRAFAELLESLVSAWPVPVTELVLIGHSMGGLVARSACHYGLLGRHAWLSCLKTMIFLGTPHHGAPLERAGNWVDLLLGSTSYSAPLARLGKIRSAGITDLRFGNVVDEDWSRHGRFARTRDVRVPVPLPDNVACYAIAATTGSAAGNPGDRLRGDGIVPLASALGRHPDPRLALMFDASRQWISYGTNHLDLLSGAEIYAQIKTWLKEQAIINHSAS